ncbi:MAG: FeoB-associated Cys-rich membrane protein [Pyrinomonadaceae bacterium]|nr:FeoB-associated Cys-rich membrane protein [Acidobacteriota bacterium]MBK7934213.1 FeoB-associated Cys-rich membrane protein [Acidobacteriota bacterium]MBP7375240.1 FeoB-associated Cys-rich membrane protein [Pyrinomonadaceae bacterium]
MSLQFIIVLIVIAAALVFAAVTLIRKRRAFSTKEGCGTDCGCGDGSKKLTS